MGKQAPAHAFPSDPQLPSHHRLRVLFLLLSSGKGTSAAAFASVCLQADESVRFDFASFPSDEPAFMIHSAVDGRHVLRYYDGSSGSRGLSDHDAEQQQHMCGSEGLTRAMERRKGFEGRVE